MGLSASTEVKAGFSLRARGQGLTADSTKSLLLSLCDGNRFLKSSSISRFILHD
jgi:hypothetical protein